MAPAYGFSKLYVGQNGLLSTPAVSSLIINTVCFGGIILTASHNPGGPQKDFGIKINMSSGATSTSLITDEIYKRTIIEGGGEITYKIYTDMPDIDLSVLEQQTFSVGDTDEIFTVQIIDSVDNYVAKMQEMFDFALLENHLSGKDAKIKVVVDCMNGVAGPYAHKILVDNLGVSPDCILNGIPKPDFGGLHPDPNLTRAKNLISVMETGVHHIGAAFDGDADRNMILGKCANFISPCDSLAVVAANLTKVDRFSPHRQAHNITGFARSMPTSSAIDKVAEKMKIPCYEVPTGWKFFGNLMDADKIVLCGEESFGIGSNYIREKDGIWGLLMWLSILAETGSTVEELMQLHWKTYGRNYYTRLDYENVELIKATEMMDNLQGQLTELKNSRHTIGSTQLKIVTADIYEYKDTIDGSFVTNQGIRLIFDDDSRIVYRLSGTGSQGATVRVYVDGVKPESELQLDRLVDFALKTSKLTEITGRKSATVRT